MSTRNHGAELPKFIDERVEACGDISSADLDERTKMMIRKIYGKDFSQLHYQWDIY
jgi:hypothetical protein